ncbi:MAG: leucine-rich repeat domain-containing protein, partial [Lachnospiraceae bacterium]|nr:leucine-rich repeat domain-containing protein [Lachnospiraceae bacterium]
MAKASKVGKRKLKRQVRKTIGALFLASALVVASIPVESLRAESIPQADHITVTDADNNIPTITANDTIYATGDGTYRFAYVRAEGSSDKVAVILQYRGGNLRDNSLVIPNVFEHVYKKYIDNDGTDQGYVAVGESGNSLYYKVQEQIAPPQDILDENGIVIGQTPPFLVDRYYPCYYENITAWNHVAATDFYYIKSNDYEDEIPSVSAGDASQFTKVDGDTSVMPISDIRVAYIGNQYLNDEGTEVAGDVTEGSRGVFAQNGNIVDLTIGDDMLGIGDYAFFRCSSLGNGDSKITLGNGLNTIGNSAFEGCINMEGIVLDKTSNLNKIGSKAFKDCQGLLEFQVPIAVQEIGDSAFEGCTAMETIILDGNYPSGKDNVALRDLGVSVFKNCSSLQYVSLPSTYTTAEDISFVQGCTSLRYIRLPNQLTELKKDYDVIDWEQFRSTVPKEFYLSGKDVSETHTLAGAEAFAFRYIDNNGNDQDIYEIIIRDGDGDDDDNKALYQVNSNNQLIGAEIGEKIKTVEIPPTIGPYQITQIDGSSFQGNCYIQELIIPPSITSIAAGAFKGCHNLYSVIFTEPVNVASIGAEAFKTQDVVIHRAGCSEQLMDPPVLTFTGPISDSGSSSAPYEYAMNASNYFNNGDQARTYITYYSGWPSNLEVRYNPETDTNELINY